MTNDSKTIRVEALGRERTFESRDALSEYVATFIDHGHYSPFELAALRKRAELGNGSTPPQVERIVRETGFYGPSTDAEAERAASPFGSRIESLREALEEAEAKHEAAREALFNLRDQLRSADRRRYNENLSRADRQRAADEVERLRPRLHELTENEQDADRACVRARAALNKARKAADRWRADRASRFVVGPPGDRQVVNREELTSWLDAQR